MPEPGQFEVNDAWIVFRLNDAPICTEADGDFNVLCLMDAASCYILGNEFIPAGFATIPEPVLEKLLGSAKTRTGLLPARLLVSAELDASGLKTLTKHPGIEVVSTADEELSPFISEAREGFRAHMGTGRLQ